MKLRDWITLSASIVLIITAFIIGMRCRTSNTQQVMIQDTLYIEKLIADTVLHWQDKIIWREVKPETIYLYPDTIATDTIWGRWPETILTATYGKGKLNLTSILPVDSTDRAVFKAYSFDVSDRFSVHAKGQGFQVRSLRSYPGFELALGSEFRVWGDSSASLIVPYAQASLTWKGLSLGPRIDPGVFMSIFTTDGSSRNLVLAYMYLTKPLRGLF